MMRNILLTISPQHFQAQLDMLQKHGFTPIGLDELKASFSNRQTPARQTRFADV